MLRLSLLRCSKLLLSLKLIDYSTNQRYIGTHLILQFYWRALIWDLSFFFIHSEVVWDLPSLTTCYNHILLILFMPNTCISSAKFLLSASFGFLIRFLSSMICSFYSHPFLFEILQPPPVILLLERNKCAPWRVDKWYSFIF